jgi:hypothetical protein
MQIKIWDSELKELIYKELLDKGVIQERECVQEIVFDYDRVSEEVTGATILLNKK